MYTPGASETRYAYYEGGKYAGKLMWAEDYHAMAERAAYGVQSVGTGVGSGYSGAAVSEGGAVATKLKAVGTTAGTIATVRGLKGDTVGLMTRLKSYGLLKGLGTIALGFTAFETGWQIGSAISDLFWPSKTGEGGELPASGFQYLEAINLVTVDAGDDLSTAALSCIENKAVMCNHVKAARAGTIVEFRDANGGKFKFAWTNRSAAGCQEYTYFNTPAGAETIAVGTAGLECSKEGTGVYNVIFVPLTVSCLPGDTGGGCPGSPKSTKTTSGQTPEPANKATMIMEECFAGLIVCGRFPGWWWNNDPNAKERTVSDGTGTGLDPSDPLQVRIPAFGRHEKYTAYEAKLEALELVPEVVELPEEWANPNYGPEEVTQVNPKPTSQVEPETVVKVRFNPSTATETAPGGESEVPAEATGPWSPPSIPAIDLNPLSLPVGCNTFPFGVFCWVSEGLGSWGSGAGTCPNVAIPIHNGDLEADFCTFEPAMEIIRPVIVIMATFSLVWLFAAAAMGFGASTGGDDD